MSVIQDLATLTERLASVLDRLESREGVLERMAPPGDDHWLRFRTSLLEWTHEGVRWHAIPWTTSRPTIHHSKDGCTVYPHDVWVLKDAGYRHIATHQGCPIWGYSNGHRDGVICPELAALVAKVPQEWRDVPIA